MPFTSCIYGSQLEPGLVFTTTKGHQNTIMLAISALERFRAEQYRNATVNSRVQESLQESHRLE